MNAATGPMIDASGSGNDGTLEDIQRVAPGYNGRGRAYRFNGTSSRVIVGNDASLNPGSRNITFTAHVKTNVPPPPSIGDYDLVRKGSGIYKMEILGTRQGLLQVPGVDGQRLDRGGTERRGRALACHHVPEDPVADHAHRGRRVLVGGRPSGVHLESLVPGPRGEAERIGRPVPWRDGRGQRRVRLSPLQGRLIRTTTVPASSLGTARSMRPSPSKSAAVIDDGQASATGRFGPKAPPPLPKRIVSPWFVGVT